MTTTTQSVWHKASLHTRAEAALWCKEHNFDFIGYRAKEDDGVTTHHIHYLFQPNEAKENSWAILSDDFPEGISLSICERKSMEMKTTKGVQSASDPFTFVMSDESVDRTGDIIRAKGWMLDDFKKNPVALFGHAHDKPIGVWEDVKVMGKKLVGRLRLAEKGTSPEIDTIRSLIEQRILKAVSVGFQALEGKPLKEKGGGFEFTKQALHECSLVAVPCNQNALSIAKSFGANPDKIFSNSEGRIAAPVDEIKQLKKHRPLADANIAKLKTSIEKLNNFLEKRK